MELSHSGGRRYRRRSVIYAAKVSASRERREHKRLYVLTLCILFYFCRRVLCLEFGRAEARGCLSRGVSECV